MKWRYLFVFLIFFLIYKSISHKNIAPVSQTEVQIPVTEKRVVKKDDQITPPKNIQSEAVKDNETTASEFNDEEFIAQEKRYATSRLKLLIVGWCNASENEVITFILDGYAKDDVHRRQEITNLSRVCFNQENKETECFTYQANCSPERFKETTDIELLQFWDGASVFRYERNVMDYKTYIENPENPAVPGRYYWVDRAYEIKLLAERIRGEPIDKQNWGLRDSIEDNY